MSLPFYDSLDLGNMSEKKKKVFALHFKRSPPHSTKAMIPSSKPKGLLVDNLGNCALLIAALLYFCLFFGAVGGGASGPQIFSQASNPTAVLRQNCVDLGSCQAVWFGTLTDMSPQHQFMWLSMNMERPTAASGSPALANSPVSWGLVYQVDIVAIGADGTRILMAQNQTHAQTISFRSDGASSSDVLLFYTQVSYGYGRVHHWRV